MTTIRQTILLITVFACICTCGCNSNPDRQQIVGDWKLAVAADLEAKVNRDESDKSEKSPASDKDSDASQPPKMLVRFYNSGYLLTQTNMGMVKSEKQGKWRFVSFDVASKTVNIECDMMDETTAFEIVIQDKNRIRMVPPNMAGLSKKMTFVRQ